MKPFKQADISSMLRRQAALARARSGWLYGESAPIALNKPTHFAILGDPQAPIRKIFAHLDANGLLDENGWLNSEIGLICVGDYFDYRSNNPLMAGLEGLQFLSWLAGHSPDQVVILMGNHDAERVMSLSGVTLTAFTESRAAFDELLHIHGPNERRDFLRDWGRMHFGHPPIVAAHDYVSFHPDQSALIRRLLLSERLHMAAASVDATGRQVLITHAGLTDREVQLLGSAAEAKELEQRLNETLRKAVDAVRESWQSGGTERLDLRPLYFPWEVCRPNGGCLIHRPDSRIPSAHRHGALGLSEPEAPRSVLPDRFLLPGISQIVGHTVAADRLVSWLEPNVTQEAKNSASGTFLALFSGPDNHALLGTASQMGEHRSSMQFVDMAMFKAEPGTIQMMRVSEVTTQ